MVLFLISNYSGFNTGRGGHYYSLRQMAETITKDREIITVVLGNAPDLPAALLGMQSVYSVPTELHRQQQGLKRVIAKLQGLNCLSKLTAIHAYDAKSVYIGAHIAKKIEKPFVLTKCGGRSPKNFYPIVDTLIVFHKKDYDYFSKNSSGYSDIHLIPNRVNSVAYDATRERQIQEIRDAKAFNIFKIGRIGNDYHKTLTDTIRLCSQIQRENFPVHLSFIGYEESEKVTEKLRDCAQQLNVTLSVYSDSDYTSRASELLWACDAAVGTGRGAMEALSAKKILLFPVSNFDYPCLFNEATAPYAMQDNFSERALLPESLKGYCDPKQILTMITDDTYKRHLDDFGHRTFESCFNVEVGAKKVIDIYDNCSNIPSASKLNLFRLRLNYFNLYRKYRLKLFRRKLRRSLHLK